MKISINSSSAFRQAFYDAQRHTHYSYEGLEALFEYLDQLDQDTGTETELDVIELCCAFTEHESAVYGIKWFMSPADFNDFVAGRELDNEELEAEALNWLTNQTIVISFEGGIILHEF